PTVTRNGATPAAASAIASRTRPSVASSTDPRKRSVTWKFSIRTHETPLAWARSGAVTSSIRTRKASGSSTAAKLRSPRAAPSGRRGRPRSAPPRRLMFEQPSCHRRRPAGPHANRVAPPPRRPGARHAADTPRTGPASSRALQAVAPQEIQPHQRGQRLVALAIRVEAMALDLRRPRVGEPDEHGADGLGRAPAIGSGDPGDREPEVRAGVGPPPPGPRPRAPRRGRAPPGPPPPPPPPGGAAPARCASAPAAP